MSKLHNSKLQHQRSVEFLGIKNNSDVLCQLKESADACVLIMLMVLSLTSGLDVQCLTVQLMSFCSCVATLNLPDSLLDLPW